jgi:hypothetical protein
MTKKIPPEVYSKLKKVDSIISALTNPKNSGKIANPNMIKSLMEDLAYVVGQLNILYKQLVEIVCYDEEKN